LKQVLLALIVALVAGACGGNGSPTDPSQVTIQFSSTDLVVGTGPEAVVGNAANVRYSLWLYNAAGTDSKGTFRESGTFGLVLGQRQSIPGFEQGVLGMRVGGKRRINVPSDLGYGSRGSPPNIPPNAALVFELELLELIQ
jgi:FKBP-type peptidyl-prolyl cis-trans isomerase FkpA